MQVRGIKSYAAIPAPRSRLPSLDRLEPLKVLASSAQSGATEAIAGSSARMPSLFTYPPALDLTHARHVVFQDTSFH